jgi:hypothetical protein
VLGFLSWATAFVVAPNLMFPEVGFIEALPYYIFEKESFRREGPGPAVSIAAGIVLGLLAGGIPGTALVHILRARPPGTAQERLPHPEREGQ